MGKIKEKWYRYVDNYDYGREFSVERPAYKIVLQKFDVLKETPCGVWLDTGYKKKWVSGSTKKRFAYPTKEEAFTSYKIRKKRQIEHLEVQLNRAKQCLQIANDKM